MSEGELSGSPAGGRDRKRTYVETEPSRSLVLSTPDQEAGSSRKKCHRHGQRATKSPESAISTPRRSQDSTDIISESHQVLPRKSSQGIWMTTWEGVPEGLTAKRWHSLRKRKTRPGVRRGSPGSGRAPAGTRCRPVRAVARSWSPRAPRPVLQSLIPVSTVRSAYPCRFDLPSPKEEVIHLVVTVVPWLPTVIAAMVESVVWALLGTHRQVAPFGPLRPNLWAQLFRNEP
jgi:hypothetical protein